MLARFTRFALSLVLVAAAVPAGVRADTPAGDPAAVYARMQQVNAGLQSFQADLHVDVTTHGFPYISPSLDGKAYFERPDRSAVVFETVPALAGAFKKVYPQLEPPSEWPRIYDVSPISDDGTTSRFRLVRKKNGRIDHVDVTVDDRTATVSAMTYIYKDGGTISFQQTYAVVDGNYVITSQTGRVDIPHYSADVASTFTNYQLNVKIDQGVFATD
jgi:outer membrane lipoprotein-sorting protein